MAIEVVLPRLNSYMIYSIAEWKLRTKLEEENETVPDQKGKPTKRPTMTWILSSHILSAYT